MRLLTIGAMQQGRLILQAETKAYRDRVIADGGVIIDIDEIDEDIKYLKANDIWNDLTHIWLPYGGMKQRIDGATIHIEKWYNLKSALDAEMATPTNQPIYGAAQIGGIDILTANGDKELNLNSADVKTIVSLTTGGEYIFGGDLGGYVRNRGGTVVVRASEVEVVTITFTVTMGDPVFDVLTTNTTADYFRNGNASTSNPLAFDYDLFLTGIFRRPDSAYFNGTCALVMFGETALTTVKRQALENYYMPKFGL